MSEQSTTGWITITVPYTARQTDLTGEDAGIFTKPDGAGGLSVLRGGHEVRIWNQNIHTAIARSWPIGREQTDHAKRLAEIGEAVAERLPLSPCDGAFLWEQIHAASEALDRAGALTHMIGVGPPDAHPATLAERVEDVVAMRDHAEKEAERLRAKVAELEADVARLSAVKSAEIAPVLERFRAAFGADAPMAPSSHRKPAPDIDDVSPAHLRALEIVAYSDGCPMQTKIAGELLAMGPEAVAEAVCRAYEEGRAAEARRPSTGLDIASASDAEGMAALVGLDAPTMHPDLQTRLAGSSDPAARALAKLAADPARRAAFNAWPNLPPRIVVIDRKERPNRRGKAMREHLNAEFGLSITTADLARALRISEEDMLAIEAGTKTTDAAGRTEIQTVLFLLGSGTKAEEIADPIGSGALARALAAPDDDEPAVGDEPRAW